MQGVRSNLWFPETVSSYTRFVSKPADGAPHKMTLPAAMKLPPGPRKGKGGRPRKGDSLRTTIKVTYELRDILDTERLSKERHNDTILRIMRERAALRRENTVLKGDR